MGTMLTEAWLKTNERREKDAFMKLKSNIKRGSKINGLAFKTIFKFLKQLYLPQACGRHIFVHLYLKDIGLPALSDFWLQEIKCFCSYRGSLQAVLLSGWDRAVSGLRKKVSMYFYSLNLFHIYRKLVKYLCSASRAFSISGYQTFLLMKYLHECTHAQKPLAVFTENRQTYFVILQDI